MKYKTLGSLLLVAVLTSSLAGCENLLFQSEQNKRIAENPIKTVRETKKIQKKVDTNLKNQEMLQKEVRDYLLSFGDNISGSVSVVQNNRTLFREGFGYADSSNNVLNQPATTYPIGSISKVFVATSMMMLQEQHKINIQDPVSNYIPNFPNGNNIKLYHFLTHTSGIQRLKWHKGITTPLQLVQEIEKRPIKFQPGTNWDYLDANYMVLGYIIEKVTGQPLHDFIQKNILDQVHMKDTGFFTHDNPVPYTSIGYQIKEDNNVEATKYLNTYSLFACGDIYSTPFDLSLFDHALMSGKLVSQDSLTQMLSPGPTKSTYGIGLYNDGKLAYSIGVLGGWHTMHAYYNDNTSIVVFLNKKDKATHIDHIIDKIYQIVKDSQKLEPMAMPVKNND